VTEFFLNAQKTHPNIIVETIENKISHSDLDMDFIVKVVDVILSLGLSLKQLDDQEVGQVKDGLLVRSQSHWESHILAIPLLLKLKMANFPPEKAVEIDALIASFSAETQTAIQQWL
jgi:hypothetical protein